MIEPNVTLLIQMVNFFIFLFLMNIILYRPIRRLVAQRNAMIEAQRQGIEKAEADARGAVAEFDASIQSARAEGRQKVLEFKDSGHQAEKDLMQQASEEAARQVQAVRRDVESNIKVVREQLRDQVRAFSMELAQKVLGRTI